MAEAPQHVEGVGSESDNVLGGYAKIASKMGRSPEFLIFRRFGTLNAQNLLYLQAELTVLEKELGEYALEDEHSANEDRRNYSKDWETLKNSHDDDAEAGNNKSQWETMVKVRETLKEYSIYRFF